MSIIASVMIGVAFAGILASWLRGRKTASNSARTGPAGRESTLARFDSSGYWIPLALIPVAVLLLQLPVSLFVWNLLPKLRFLQFPWRWLVVLEAPMAVFVAAAIWPRQNLGRRWAHIAVISVCAAVFAGITAISGMVFFQVCDDEDRIGNQVAVFRDGTGVDGPMNMQPWAAIIL